MQLRHSSAISSVRMLQPARLIILFMDTETIIYLVPGISCRKTRWLDCFSRDCCVNTCVGGMYDCDRSIFDCRDPRSVFSHFCDVRSDEHQTGTAGSSADANTIPSETRAYVCANCNPAMQNFFHTIGGRSRATAKPGCLLQFFGEYCVSHAWQGPRGVSIGRRPPCSNIGVRFGTTIYTKM